MGVEINENNFGDELNSKGFLVAKVVAKKSLLYLNFSRRNHGLLSLNILLNRLLKHFLRRNIYKWKIIYQNIYQY